jgi:hypothetical protein
MSVRPTYTQMETLESALKEVEYKPGWKFELFSGLDDVVMHGPSLNVYVSFECANAYGQYSLGPVGNCIAYNPHDFFKDVGDSEELDEVRFALMIKNQIKRLELHELDEWLKIKGVRLVEPHPKKTT